MSRRSRVARYLGLPAVLVTLAMLGATSSSACSMVAPSVDGPFFTGDGWAFLYPTSTPSGYGLGGRLVFYGALGGFLDETEIESRTSEGHAWVVRVDSDRSTWWRVRCDDGESPEEALCGRLVELGPGGEIELSVPVPSEEGWMATVRGQGFVWGRFGGGELVLRRLDIEATLEAMAREPGLGQPVLEEVRRLAVPAEWVEDKYDRGISLRWAMNGEGSVAAIAITQDGVRIRRWDEDGALLWDRSFERARPGHATPEGKLAIGHPWVFGMAGDGSLVLTGWQYHADCSPDRPPGMLVLGPDGELRAEVAFESRAWGLAFDGGDGVAVHLGGTRVFDLDGHERARFAPTSPGAEAEKAAFQAKIASLGPESPVADWIDLFGRSGRDEEIAGWLVAAWPEGEPLLPDSIWLELASRLCRRHPDAAPARALARFSRATGGSKREWLGALTSCFEGLPEGSEVEAYLEQLENSRDHRDRQAARATRAAWIDSAGDLDSMWTRALERGDLTIEGRALVAGWERTAAQFERRLRSPEPYERYLAQRLLFALLPDAWEFQEAEHAELRRSVLATVKTWLDDEDPGVRGAAAVLLFGNTVADDDPPSVREEELLTALTTAARQRPELAAWAVTATLDRWPLPDSWSSVSMVERDREALAALSEEIFFDLFDALLAAVELDEVPPDFDGLAPPSDPRAQRAFQTVERVVTAAPPSRIDAVLDRMMSRAFTPEASTVSRRLLLVGLSARPDLGGVDRARRILASPWLVDRAVTPIDYIDRVWRAWPAEPRLRAQAASAYRGYLRSQLRAPDELVHSLTPARFSRSPVSELRVEDLRPFVRSPEDVEAWLPFIAETGAWPEIEADVEKALDDPHTRLSAARALAFRGEPKTLDILIEDGLGHWDPPVDAFRHYGGVRERLEALAFHRDEQVRRGARRVARALGPSPSLVESLLAETTGRLSAGELPDLDSLLLLHDEGYAVLKEALGMIAAEPDKASWLLNRGSPPRDLVTVLVDLLATPDTDAVASSGARQVLEHLWGYDRDPEAGYQLSQLEGK